MKKSIFDLQRIRNLSVWLGRIWFFLFLIVVSFAAFTFLKDKEFSILGSSLFFVLILGHLLFFLNLRNNFLRSAAFLIQLSGHFLILDAIWMINSEGTTWGAGPATIGLALLIPALNVSLGAANSRKDDRFGWLAIATGILGISITFWRKYQVEQMQKDGLEFWAPIPLYQSLGLCFLVFVVMIGAVQIFKSSSVNTK